MGLINREKAWKYMLYALGEIILVVIGILIALSINNYNEDLKEQESVKLYLKNFVADLRKDQETMQTVMEAQSFRFHALQYLLVQVGEDIYDPTSDQIMMPSLFPAIYGGKRFPRHMTGNLLDWRFCGRIDPYLRI